MQLSEWEGSLPVKDGAVSAEEGCSRASRVRQPAASNELVFDLHRALLPWGEDEPQLCLQTGEAILSLCFSTKNIPPQKNNFWHKQIQIWVGGQERLVLSSPASPLCLPTMMPRSERATSFCPKVGFLGCSITGWH